MTDDGVVHATFTLERTYATDPRAVFAAWADQEAKACWFADGADEYSLDFRVGGGECLRAIQGAKRLIWEARYHEIVPDRRIVYTGTLSEDDTLATVSLTSVELVAESEVTRLVLIEAGAYLDGREQPAWRERGTGDWLDTLGRHLHASLDGPLQH